jgi:molybdate transport system substrate-binding protein
MRVLAAASAAIAVSLSTAPVGAADIRVYSGGAPQVALRDLTAEFEKSSSHRVNFTFEIVTAIQQRLGAGERPDLILLPIPLIVATEKTVPLRSEGRTVLARVGIGVIIREGAPRPDISSDDSVRRMLAAARSIAIPQPDTPSGAHVVRLFAQLGIADELKSRLTVRSAIGGGGELVAKGEADVGMYLLSEVQSIKGVTVAGLLPPALQSFVVYGTAIPTTNSAPEPAIAFVKFLTDPARSERWKKAGFELGAAR